MVMDREVDDQRGDRQGTELTSRHYAVVAVDLHPLGQGQAGQDQHRRQRTTDDSEPGVALPDIVEQASHDHLGILDAGGDDREGGMISVTLVGVVLGKEDLDGLRRQPALDSGLLGRGQPSGGRNVQESREEVGR